VDVDIIAVPQFSSAKWRGKAYLAENFILRGETRTCGHSGTGFVLALALWVSSNPALTTEIGALTVSLYPPRS
jgi:hypothetical protein